jgi:hypothetical protein
MNSLTREQKDQNFEQYLAVLVDDDEFNDDEMEAIVTDLRAHRELFLCEVAEFYRGEKLVGTFPTYGLFSRAAPSYPIEADDSIAELTLGMDRMGIQISYNLFDRLQSWAGRARN